MRPLRVGFLGFNGVMALDLVGPIDAFTTAGIDASDGKAGSLYETVIIGLSNKPFRSESGIAFNADKSIANAPSLDTLMIPGGYSVRLCVHAGPSHHKEHAPEGFADVSYR